MSRVSRVFALEGRQKEFGRGDRGSGREGRVRVAIRPRRERVPLRRVDARRGREAHRASLPEDRDYRRGRRGPRGGLTERNDSSLRTSASSAVNHLWPAPESSPRIRATGQCMRDEAPESASGIGRAYNRTSFVAERTTMMQEWADYLDRLKSSGRTMAPAATKGA